MVIADPAQMARKGFRVFWYLAGYAYTRKTGQDYEYEVALRTRAGRSTADWMREDEDSAERQNGPGCQ
jgi:hypothetical protein